MVARKNKAHEYPDDIFADTRMTFGEHIEELRVRMIRGLAALMVLLVFGFILDAIGEAIGNKKVGIGRPMLEVITDPVESQVRDFYNRRTEKEAAKKLAELTNTPEDEIEQIRQKLKENGDSLSELTADERQKLLGAPQPMPVVIPTAPLAEALGVPADKMARKEVTTTIQVYPAHVSYLSDKGQALLGTKKYLTTLSAQEAFVVYFKVSILCGIVLGSPILLYQFWAFVGAGLYPHEKRYVYVFFWPSVILFLFGVLLCQFFVLPGAVKALLKFNEFLGFDPDIRLNEWLGLAIILPLVFGISFQTPLVMIFLNRIGIFSAKDYVSKWRYACFFLALFAALITPTPDVITMMYLFVPMFGLYLAGIAFCHYFPGGLAEEDEEETAEEVAV
jgi:sec-independent protein translocase protein TatC